MNVEKRIEIEKKVVRKLVREMKAAGWMPINVYDGEETVPVSTETEVLDNVFAVDDSRIVFRKVVVPLAPMRRSAVIVLGNGGWDCIADHSLSADHKYDDFVKVMDEVIYPYCEKLDLESR